MKQKLFITLYLSLLFCNNTFAENIITKIDAGSQYNANNNVTTDYTGMDLLFEFSEHEDGNVYMGIGVKEDDNSYMVVINGSSKRRRNIYNKGIEGAVLGKRFESIGNPIAFYELISNSSSDDRQMIAAIGCYNMSNGSYVVIKKMTFQGKNYDSALFSTNIVSKVDDDTLTKIIRLLNKYIPKIGYPRN